MSKIVVEATFTLSDAARRDELLIASVQHQRATREDEPGCLSYLFAADPVHDDVVQVYEMWESEAALAAHFEHPNYWAMRKLLEGSGLIIDATIAKHRIEVSGPIYGADRTPTATFD